MKQFNIIALCAMSIIALASCELKNELLGNTTEKTEEGLLELGVAVKQPGGQTRAEVSTDDFPVTITGKPGTATADVTVNFESVKDLPLSISLPVGEYTVTSHTNKEFKTQMDEPYYGGSADLTITKGITSKTTVTCKMKNSRVQLKYGTDFTNSFSSWNITIDDGNSNTLVHTEKNASPAPKYWNFADNAVTAIKVNIRAKTQSGNSVNESRTFKKSDVAENYEEVTDYFSGGDALEINMGATTSSTGNVTGVTIKTDITFEENGETVEIPTEGESSGGDTPTPPSRDALTVTCIGKKTNNDATKEDNVFETGVEYSIVNEDWPTTDISISTPTGLKSLKVTIVGGNEGFEGICSDMEFTDYELVGESGEMLSAMLFELGVSLPMPETNCTSYTFPVGQFYSMMNIYGPTVDADQTVYKPDGKEFHEFLITAEDNDGNKVGPLSLKVTIKK